MHPKCSTWPRERGLAHLTAEHSSRFLRTSKQHTNSSSEGLLKPYMGVQRLECKVHGWAGTCLGSHSLVEEHAHKREDVVKEFPTVHVAHTREEFGQTQHGRLQHLHIGAAEAREGRESAQCMEGEASSPHLPALLMAARKGSAR